MGSAEYNSIHQNFLTVYIVVAFSAEDNSIHQNFLTIVVLKLAMRDEEAASELHQKFLSCAAPPSPSALPPPFSVHY